MSVQHRQPPLSRLMIPPSLNSQQPVSFENQAVYSPGLPTTIQQGMHAPPWSLGPAMSLQTPIQQMFAPIPPGTPGRPISHRGHASMAQLAAAGIRPPVGIPMTPLGQGQFPTGSLPPMILPGQQFLNRNRRTTSISAGGPPKAVLGGPAAKNRVPSDAVAPPIQPITPQKAKKVVVNFPKESVFDEDTKLSRRELWARRPLHQSEIQEMVEPGPPEAITLPVYPADQWRYTVPDTVDVFLPGKAAWDEYRQRVINDKLERLGVERGFAGTVGNGSSDVPHIHAPHARAASISSPADPALLFFKLNKLHQSQNASISNSLSSSPQPPLNLTPSPQLQGPNQVLPRTRHGHSMSLVNPGSLPPSAYNPASAFNPFGPQAILGSDEIYPRIVNEVESNPLTQPEPSPPNSLPLATVGGSQAVSRPDFVIGFGLDIPEEEEPEEDVQDNDDKSTETTDASTPDGTEVDSEVQKDDTSSLGQVNSRHRHRLSAALSLQSVGRQIQDPLMMIPALPPIRSPVGNPVIDDLDVTDKDTDAVGEWTGSEDVMNDAGSSEGESIGEWSNPSDEERARQVRRQKRMLRRAQQTVHSRQDIPRKLPDFPRPPMTTGLSPLPNPEEEDMLSNPSDEEKGMSHHYQKSISSTSGKGRPLPPLPHSRATSAQISSYDSALAHSRSASGQVNQPITDSIPPQSAKSLIPSLNPLAKPFVFGAPQPSPWTPVSTNSPSLPKLQSMGHSRTVSLGKPLNAAASEFKPTGFTFRPPAMAPQMTFAPPSTHDVPDPSPSGRPLPVPPVPQPALTREIQGREKRRRRGSSATLDGEERRDDLTLFKFPPASDIGKIIHRSAPPTPAAFDTERRNPLGLPPSNYTVDGFLSDVPLHKPTEVASFGRANNVLFTGAGELPVPPQPKPKRAPLPLDFKHPVSTNTVPAGLFKALVNGEGDERTRRHARSRLGSRDAFDHSPRPSLDDLNVPTISRKISRPRLVTDPSHQESSVERAELVTAPRRRRRRSSLPALPSTGGSSSPDMSPVQNNLLRHQDILHLEQKLETLLDKKLDAIHQDILKQQDESGSAINTNTESMISDVVSLFRTQLQESAARGLDDSQQVAREELDFELVRGIINQANTEYRAIMQRDLAEVLRRVEVYTRSLNARSDLAPLAEEITARTVSAVVGITQQLAARIEAFPSPTTLVRELMNVISPHLVSLRPEPIDYDVLTGKLSQAVKPNISQLIDLASDKRETAGLILDRLLPVLQSVQPSTPTFDAQDMITKIVAEVRRIVGQVDAHEIKEQVSDLVVERLDSRLANRDRLEGLVEKVKEGVISGLGPMPGEVASIFMKLATIHRDISEINPEDLSSLRHDVLSMLSDLPNKLGAATEAMNAALIDLRLHRVTQTDQDLDDRFSKLESLLNNLTNDQRAIFSQTQEIVSLHNDVVSHVSALPASLVEATNGLQDSQADLVSRIQLSQNDAEELRKLSASNAELQIQLTKARGAHGQVRVEKDVLAERLGVLEAEKDGLREQLLKLQTSFTTKSAEAASTEARNLELEEALTQALARLQSADVSVQTHQERIAELEKITRDHSIEKQELQSKIHSVHLEASLAARDKESAQEKASSLQKQLDQFLAQQSHWDEMHHAAEQIGLLTSLVEQADNEELRELRRNRDRAKILEGEFAALQRRFKDQENKIASHDRAMGGVRQNLAQAQQRAAEWEKRAKEQEAEIESTRARLDEADQAHTQMDAEISLVKLELKEKEDDERQVKDRESELRDQVALLEDQVARLQTEADIAKAMATVSVLSPQPNGLGANSPFTPPPRPDSRTSTTYGPSRSVTPTSIEKSTRAYLASQGVWNSMHNPHRQTVPTTPKARYSKSFRTPSPALSIASTAPSIDENGWWS